MKVSVVTATLNSRSVIETLANSLLAQTDQDFEWVVADGGSSDGTVEYLRSLPLRRLVLVERADFGIYDALNGAIKASVGEYYVVIGSDDSFSKDAIASFKLHAEKSAADIVTAAVDFCGKRRHVLGGSSAVNRQFAFVSSHAVSTAFRKSLHERFGYYSRAFPIAADQFFILKACLGGATVCKADFVAGAFSPGGVSSVDYLGVLTESYRIQVKFHPKLFQTIRFFWLVLRRYKNIR